MSLEIGDKLLASLYNHGKEHYPNEFGGLLVGYYSENGKTVIINNTILPEKYKASKYVFERGITGMKEKLEVLFKKVPSSIYVGEWHTHPDNPPIPSSTDVNAMNEITNHKDVSIKNPVLLIIGYNKKKIELGFYVQFKNKLYKYEQ